MRQTLFRIPFDYQIPVFGGKVPLFGFGVMLALCVLVGLWKLYRTPNATVRHRLLLPTWRCRRHRGGNCDDPRIHSLPVYGYGSMLLLGFLVAAGSHPCGLDGRGWIPKSSGRRHVGLHPGDHRARAFFIIQTINSSSRGNTASKS